VVVARWENEFDSARATAALEDRIVGVDSEPASRHVPEPDLHGPEGGARPSRQAVGS